MNRDVVFHKKLNKQFTRFYKSAWLFPAVLLIPLIVFTLLGISGSSVGVYHKFLYGNTSVEDKNLILGEPRPIRGDEWNFVTQITISQSKNNFPVVNKNVGEGQNISVLQDVPYGDWSILLKPHNVAFLILPFDNAFAFKWWFMLYLLILSAYCFVLMLLPGRRLLASILAIGFAFSPFVQWWYLYGTIGSLYYTLFAGVVSIKILRANKNRPRLLWGLLLTYALACFACVLYPPFQIPCALVMLAFMVGYILEKMQKQSFKSLLPSLGIIAGAIVLSLIIVFAYIMTRQDVFQSLANTAYPGARVVNSGGFSLPHLVSGQFSNQIQNPLRIVHYKIGGNESEAANFVLLIPFLILPGIFLLLRRYKLKKSIDWPLLTTTAFFVLLLIRLYVPYTDLVFKPLLLGSIPHERILIGIGLLSFIHMVLIIRFLARTSAMLIPRNVLKLYIMFMWAFSLLISIYVYKENPGFIGLGKAAALSTVLPLITYLILSRRFTLGASLLCAFLLYSGAGVNPLYRGVSVITESPLSKSIQRIASKEDGRWATESYLYEQFPMLNNARSLTGVYPYPQLSLWKDSGAPDKLYNRYAHVNLVIDRNLGVAVNSQLALKHPDSIDIYTEPCSKFLQERDVKFILTSSSIPDGCLKLVETVSYPTTTFYIYRINYR